MLYKTIVINLDKDLARLSAMQIQFKNLDIPYERLSAINPKEDPDALMEYDNTASLIENGYSLNLGEIGCALSHKRCAEILIKEHTSHGTEYLLVCEDDIIISDKNFKKIIETQMLQNNARANKWEYLQFDYDKPGLWWIYVWCVQVKNTFFVRKTNSEKIIHLVYSFCKIPFVFLFAVYEGIRNNIYRGPVKFYRNVYLAGCYMLHVEGAKKLLQLSKKIVYPADKIQNISKKKLDLKIKYYCPSSVHQDRTFATNIGS